MTVIDRITAPACACDGADLQTRLTPVNAALEAGIALARPVAETETISLDTAVGRTLSAPVVAQADMPRFDNSGMDGYALRHADAQRAGAGTIPVSGTSAAGSLPHPLPSGTAMRIYTGAPLPQGADTVVMQEHVIRDRSRIRVERLPEPGANIRRQGEDQRKTDRVLEPGTRLTPRGIAACAAAGAGRVEVRRRLRIALLLTGDELCPPGARLREGTVWDVNASMLSACLQADGAELIALRHVADNRAALALALMSLAQQADLVVTSGGVSVGDRDHVKPALRDTGAEIRVSGVAIKPGKPVTISRLGDALILSLPGNPVSAFVTWQVLGRPLAVRMAGGVTAGPERRHVRTGQALHHRPGRCEFRPAILRGYDHAGREVATCAGGTRSAHAVPLATADGLILIPGDSETVPEGDLLEFLPF